MTKDNKKMKLVTEAILSIIDTSKHAVSSLELENITSQVIKILPRTMDIDGAIVRLIDARNPRLLKLEGSSGIQANIIDKIKYVRIGIGIEGVTAKSRVYSLVKDLRTDGGLKDLKDFAKNRFRSALCVPIIFDNEIYGTICVFSKAQSRYTEKEGTFLRTFSNVVGIALKNASLYKNLKESYLNTINSLVLIMESRDPYMRGHSERVTYLAVEIARDMNLSESDLEILRTAGKLHDIGKITISDKILSKPGRLTPAEWAQIQMHPIRGLEIVMPLKFLEAGLQLIRSHHEKYDGSGYPDGLRKNSIPILARILSVADAFDAMTSTRPYRKAYTFEKTKEEIRRNSGTQFDPTIATTFLKIIDKIR